MRKTNPEKKRTKTEPTLFFQSLTILYCNAVWSRFQIKASKNLYQDAKKHPPSSPTDKTMVQIINKLLKADPIRIMNDTHVANLK